MVDRSQMASSTTVVTAGTRIDRLVRADVARATSGNRPDEGADAETDEREGHRPTRSRPVGEQRSDVAVDRQPAAGGERARQEHEPEQARTAARRALSPVPPARRRLAGDVPGDGARRERGQRECPEGPRQPGAARRTPPAARRRRWRAAAGPDHRRLRGRCGRPGEAGSDHGGHRPERTGHHPVANRATSGTGGRSRRDDDLGEREDPEGERDVTRRGRRGSTAPSTADRRSCRPRTP